MAIKIVYPVKVGIDQSSLPTLLSSPIWMGTGFTMSSGPSISGTGSVNRISKFTSPYTIGDTITPIHEDIDFSPSRIAIGATAATAIVSIVGTSSFGSVLFDINGSQGQLFSVTDQLTGDIFIVSDISAIPILTVNSNTTVTVDGYLKINSYVYTGLTPSTTVVAQILVSSGSGAYFDYYVKDSNNYMRIGTVMTVWNTTSGQVEYTDTSTNDLNGSTLDIQFTVTNDGTNIKLNAVIVSGIWKVKTGIRII